MTAIGHAIDRAYKARSRRSYVRCQGCGRTLAGHQIDTHPCSRHGANRLHTNPPALDADTSGAA